MTSETRWLPVDGLETLRLRKSAKWRTYPADVLPLTVAEMDFGLAPPVQEALRAAVERSDTGYAMPAPELGGAFADFARRRWSWNVDPEAVAAVPDVGVGVVELLRVLAHPGDAVVISPPVYPPFFEWASEARTRLVEAPLRLNEVGWRLDFDELEKAFAAHPAVYVLCNPHNPVGRVHSSEELATLAGLACRYGVTIVSDEIHAPLALPGATFTPMLTVPGAAAITVSVLSASKAWNLAGLKCAVIVTASEEMASRVNLLPPDVRWRTGHFGVLATVAAFADGGSWLNELLSTLEQRRTLLTGLLHDRLPEVTWQAPEATFLAWLDCRAFGDGDEPRDRFLEAGRVALEPGLRFGHPGSGYVRLNFGTSAEILDEATARMARAVA
jgi:cystathionine beta-lyase